MRLILSFIFVAAFSSTVFAQTAEQEGEMVGKVKEAFLNKNAKTLLELFCWDRVDKTTREEWDYRINDIITNVLDKAEITAIEKGELIGDYSIGGTTYTMNITPTKSLKLTSKPEGGESVEGSFFVGLKGDKLMIAVPAPVEASTNNSASKDGWDKWAKLMINHPTKGTYTPAALEMIASGYLKEQQIAVDKLEPVIALHVCDTNVLAEVKFHKAENVSQVVVIGPDAKPTKTYELRMQPQ